MGGRERDEAELRPGDALGRFVVRAELGRGGMGVVYAADDARLGREVALKVLALSDGDEARRRFLREARAAAALTAPGIATVYDVGEDAGRIFIAMELVRGRTLRALLDARPPHDPALPVAEALQIGREMARAVAAAHGRGVVHRDLKPENVMVIEGGLVKVLDFGLAKQIDAGVSAASAATSTEVGRILGTPRYMSPEQAKGRGVDVRSDVFSLGVILYELTTGRRPFERPTVVETFVAVDRDEPAPLAELNPRLPSALARVVARCLRKDPGDRYADAGELLADLEPVSVVARPPSRGRAALGVGLAVIAVGLVALAASRRAPPVAEPRPSAALVPATALPDPVTPSAEALAAYRRGLAAFRSGDGWGVDFERAIALDPGFPAAHLRLAAIAMAEAVPSAREHFRKAEEGRAALSPRDRDLLDAIEPVVRRQPASFEEANRRLAALVARHPGDAELHFLLGCGVSNHSDFDVGAGHYARAVEIDPEFSRAHAGMAMNQAYLGRFDDARRTIERCLARSPASASCLVMLARMQATAGECAGLEATARRLLAAGTEAPSGFGLLAMALAARGQPASTVREALRQAGAAVASRPETEAGEKKKHALALGVKVDALTGDLESVERAARAFAALVEGSGRQDDHGQVARWLGGVLAEQGRDKEAAEVALDFLDRRDAWEPNPGAEDVALARDATPDLLVLALRGGRLGRADVAARRAAWMDAWKARLTPVSRPFLWPHGYARAVSDEADAREALAALPGHGPLPPFRPEATLELSIGRTYLLAGQPGEASRWLSTFTTSCFALAFPLEHTQAHLWLGEAREAEGDTAGACAAYRVVLDRWGKAKPRSVTADAARDRAKALRCGG